MLFHPAVLRIPEERIQPGTILALKKQEAFYAGQLKALFPSVAIHEEDVQQSTVANISGKSSSRVERQIGLDCLGNFLNGFGASVPNIGSAFQETTHVSFSFNGVMRKYIQSTRLGAILKDVHFDKRDPHQSIYLGEKAEYRPLIVDSVITSNEFTITASGEQSQKAKIKVKVIQEMLARITAALRLEVLSETTISFVGQKQLTFAFSCILLDVAPAGRIVSLPPQVKEFQIRHAHPTQGDLPAELSFQHYNLREAPGFYSLGDLTGR